MVLVAYRFAWPDDAWGFPGFAAALAIPFASVGSVVIARRPTNGLPW